MTGPIAAASPDGVDVRFDDGTTRKVIDGTPAMVKSAFDGVPFRVEFAEASDSVCALEAGNAVGDEDGPASGFFLVTACPGSTSHRRSWST